MTTIRKAVIPAAGLGTRFLPATKALPKEMLPILDKPVIQFIVEEAVTAGIKDILIISGRHKRAIEDHFDQSFELEATLLRRGKEESVQKIQQISKLANIHYIRQKEPNGLGDAVLQAKSFIGNEPFALLLGDDIVDAPAGFPSCTKQLAAQYAKHQCSILGVQMVGKQEVERYGIVDSTQSFIEPGELLPVKNLVEKPSPSIAPSRIAIMGRYILEPDIFRYIEQIPAREGGEIQLTDGLHLMNQDIPMKAYGIHGIRHDIGNPLGFLQANLSYALKNPIYQLALQHLIKDFLRQADDKTPINEVVL